MLARNNYKKLKKLNRTQRIKVMQTIYNYFYKLRAFTVWLFLLLLVLGFNTVQAQESGKITGKVLDKDTGESLPGAEVFIGGTTLGTTTSSDGEYILRQVTPGKYDLIFKYIGYHDKKIPITVEPGKTLKVNVSLENLAVQGQEVKISAQALGQTQAINQQLSSNTITNVVSSERIQDIPDVNAAESVGRLPGISVVRSGGEGQKVTIRGMAPQYNVIMVNGVRLQSTDRNNRSVDLNMIAPNILSGISVTKALTADMDADAVGGTVNLKIGKAKKGFHSKFSLQDGYASLANTQVHRYGNYRMSGLITNRFLNDKLGLQVAGFLDNHNRNSDVLSAGYATNQEDKKVNGFLPTYLSNVNIDDRVTDRQRAGGSVVLDYQLPSGSLILNNFISGLHEHQITQNNYFSTGYDWRGNAEDSKFTNSVISNALQGEYEFWNIQMDFSLSNSVSKQHNPDNLSMDIRPKSGGTQGLTSPASNLNKMSPSQFLNSVTVIPKDKIVTGTNSLIRDVKETAQSAALNFKVPFNFTDYLSGNVKFGGKYTRNKRNNNETALFLNTDRGGLAAPFISLLKDSLWTDLGMQPSDTYIKDNLMTNPNYDVGNFLSGNEGINSNTFYDLISIGKMHHMEQLARQNGYYLPDPLGSTQYDYNYTRNFHAFYFMTKINLGKYITLLPGIRYEKFGFDYTADSTVEFGRLTTPGEHYFDTKTVQWDSTKGENWFPQVQVRIKPTSWLDVRLASTKSIIYPDYRAVSPYLFMDTYASPTLRLGNPYLKPALTQNYDIYASIYENHIGLFTAGFFYKRIHNFIVSIEYKTKDASKIHNRISLPQNGDPTVINTWTNLDKTSYVKGFELDWQTHFWYLPSIFHGLVFNINYTHINSRTRYPNYYTKKTGSFPFYKYTTVDTTRTGRLIDQPDDILNLTVGYDIGGFSARLSYQYTNNILRGINSTYQELDSYTAPYSRWDFTAYQKLPWLEGLQVYLNVNNITNTPDRQFSSVLEKLSNVQYYGRTADFGVRYSF